MLYVDQGAVLSLVLSSGMFPTNTLVIVSSGGMLVFGVDLLSSVSVVSSG